MRTSSYGAIGIREHVDAAACIFEPQFNSGQGRIKGAIDQKIIKKGSKGPAADH